MRLSLSKKEIIAIFLLALLVLAGVLFQKKEQTVPGDEWGIYHNKKHGYSIEYPAFTGINPIEFHSQDQVSFPYPNSQDAIVAISASQTSYKSLADWLNDSYNYSQIKILEKKTRIDGYEAWITYLQNKPGFQPSDVLDFERVAAFIKDGVLFEFYLRSVDHDRILNSFKFE